jgi:hypothetical protein
VFSSLLRPINKKMCKYCLKTELETSYQKAEYIQSISDIEQRPTYRDNVFRHNRPGTKSATVKRNLDLK